MGSKLKQSVEIAVAEAMNLMLSKLKLKEPSAKVSKRLKKISKKLVGHLKDEINRSIKKNSKIKVKNKPRSPKKMTAKVRK